VSVDLFLKFFAREMNLPKVFTLSLTLPHQGGGM
jgi:hypothetical protein